MFRIELGGFLAQPEMQDEVAVLVGRYGAEDVSCLHLLTALYNGR
jgi:hypothetical protein